MSSVSRALRPLRRDLNKCRKEKPEITLQFQNRMERDAHLSALEDFREQLSRYKELFTDVYKQYLEQKWESDADQKTADQQAEEDAELLSNVEKILGDITSAIRKLSAQQERERQEVVDQRQRSALIEARQNEAAAAAAAVVPKTPTVKLPKLELPTFDGTILKWREFWDVFDSTINQNASLSDVQKMAYLKSQLTNDAARAISGLAATTENYTAAINILHNRFGNNELVIDAHYAAISDLAPASNQKKNLRTVVDTLEQHLNSLEALGEDVNTRQTWQMIKSKLPPGVVLRLEEQREIDENVWDTNKFRERLLHFITLRESVEHSTSQRDNASSHHTPSTIPKSTGSSFYKSNSSQYKPRATTDALLASSTYKPHCAFCGKNNHYSDECQKYTTVEERKKRLIDRCYNCLGKIHPREHCKRDKPCWYCKQVKAHHPSLCPKRTPPKPTESAAIASESNLTIALPIDMPRSESSLLAHGETGILQTATATMHSLDGRYSAFARAVFDTGSQRSYISATLAKKLHLKVLSKGKLSVFTFGSGAPKDIDISIVKLKIQLRDGSFFELFADIVPTVTGFLQRAPIDTSKLGPLCQLYPLADTLPKELTNSSVDLLIGIEYYNELVLPQRIQVASGLYLIGSRLGWLLSGRYKPKSQSPQRSTLTTLLTHSHSIIDNGELSFLPADEQVAAKLDPKILWDLETIGINEKIDTKGDETALKNFNDTVQYQDNRFFVTWPWKEGEIDLPSNYQLALGRLNSLLRRHRDQPQVIADYHAVLEQQLQLGIIEKVEISSPIGTRCHYIPHHAVVTPERTTKLRIVYDGSAKTKKDNKSLNELLYRGPVFLQDVCTLLLRFRFNKVALVADIEKAFLQVGLQEADRDVTRFLWLRDPTLLTTENNLQEYRFARVPFGVISSAFLLAATILYLLKKDNSPIANDISQSMYVDNLITGVHSKRQALEYYSKAKELFCSASMNIREWGSNCASFIQQLPDCDRAGKTMLKVLGVPWNMATDELSIPAPSTTVSRTVTKRSILKFAASIFDPLGLFSPTVLLAKLLLQKLWLQKMDWDEILPPATVSEWDSIVAQIEPISTFTTPRYIGGQIDSPTYELHGFSDASEKAYGACIFIRIHSPTKSIAHLLFAKARVAPVRGLTLPCLELLAVQICTHCLDFVEKSLPFRIDRKFVWTDSQCVLRWLESKKPLTVFVRNRIANIKKVTNITFRYVPSAQNPADYASRGKSADDLISSSMWWQGPPWLCASEISWPPMDFLSASASLDDEPSILYSTSALCSEGAEAENSENSPFGIDVTQYSSFEKLLRITATCLLFTRRWIRRLKKETVEFLPVSATELRQAKILWIRSIQKKHFSEVFSAIEKNRRHPLIAEFGLWLDSDNILRCGGRLANSELPELTKYPILLPKKDYFSKLIIRHIHLKLFHSGVSHTLAQLRTEYWIPSGRSSVFHILRDCKGCKKYDGGSYRLPEIPPLPKTRVTEAPPFTATGLDYLGPLYIQSCDQKTKEKVWICLFTCLSTRAVHLELIEDMSAEQFLLCFQRFMARRGKPSIIISDNAKQFKLVKSFFNEIWKNVLESDEVITFVSNQGIEWKFITERAPWQGGFYERLVRLVKQALRKTLGKLCLTLCQLQTVIVEIEAMINSRPLAYVGSDFPAGDVITPAHFLSLNPKTGMPAANSNDLHDEEFIQNLSSKDRLVEIWKKGQRHLHQFWKSWKNDYLLNLRERSQRFIKQQNRRLHEIPRIGDVVLVRSDGARGTWKLARIIKLITGSDGDIRSAQIRMANGKTTQRSLMHLFPLESDVDYVSETKEQTDLNEPPPIIKGTKESRPKRKAAEKAMIKIAASNLDQSSEEDQ